MVFCAMGNLEVRSDRMAGLADLNIAPVLLRADRKIHGAAESFEPMLELLPSLTSQRGNWEMACPMKLCSFTADGLVTNARIVDLSAPLPHATLRDLLASVDLVEDKASSSEPADFPFDAVAHAPVIPNLDKIIYGGPNYHDRTNETGRVETPKPVLFACYAESQISHEEALGSPLESDKSDCGGELSVIIDTEYRRASEVDALSCVAGYACHNYRSVRDWQKHIHQLMPGKPFAKTGPFAPCLTPADEIPDQPKLRPQASLNGEVMQDTTDDLLIASIPRLICYCTTILSFLPGDIIDSSTPGGVRARREPPAFMKDGDICEVEISDIGIPRNPVVAERSTELF